MGLASVKQLNIQPDQQHARSTRYQKLRAFLRIWELYPIIFIAAFLRLYRINAARFSDDPAWIFRMARDAITYGLWPITSNRSTLGSLHPPFSVYLFMIPAAVSANPLWGEVMVGLLNTAAVILAYVFTRRYYGRLTATLTALLYATSILAILQSRYIWQPNLLPFFTMLFLFMLFRGVIDRRKGWLAPALVLLGMLYQVHESAIFLIIPFFFAMVFAFKTIRLREIVLAVLALLLLFTPFIYWIVASNFSDAKYLNIIAHKKAVTDTSAFQFYERFLSPYIKPMQFDIDQLSTDPKSVLVATPLSSLRGLLQQEHDIMPLLLICAIAMAGIQIVLPLRKTSLVGSTALRKNGLFKWWMDLLATPYRQGLVLLLSWQIVPLLVLLHHTFTLLRQDFIILLPGPFILIALLITGIIKWIEGHLPSWSVPTRWCMYAMAACIICAQFIGSTAVLLDNVNGYFDANQTVPVYYDLSSLQHALAEADQLAQQYHIHRIYLSNSDSTQMALPYLAEQLKTPTTIFDTSKCFVLPSSSSEPAIFLSQPYSPLDDTIVNSYTRATLVGEPPHLAGNPFKLYILTANPTPSPIWQSHPSGIQLLSSNVQQLQSSGSDQRWLITRWILLTSAPTAPRTLYTFNFQIQVSGRTKTVPNNISCALTSIQAGDQLLVFLKMSKSMPGVRSIAVGASSSTQVPASFKLGPLQLVSYYTHSIDQRRLHISVVGKSHKS